MDKPLVSVCYMPVSVPNPERMGVCYSPQVYSQTLVQAVGTDAFRSRYSVCVYCTI